MPVAADVSIMLPLNRLSKRALLFPYWKAPIGFVAEYGLPPTVALFIRTLYRRSKSVEKRFFFPDWLVIIFALCSFRLLGYGGLLPKPFTILLL